jgi:DNA-binding transcriptional MerR regulator
MIRTTVSGPIEAFSTPLVSRLTGIPIATLNHWVATGLIKPSIRGRAGKRATQYWNVTDLIQVKAIRALRNAGCPLQQIKKVRKLLDKCEGDFANRRLIWTGYDVLIVSNVGGAMSALRRPGQGVLHADSRSGDEDEIQRTQFHQKSTFYLGTMHEVASRQLEKHSVSVDVAHLNTLQRERNARRRKEMRPARTATRG